MFVLANQNVYHLLVVSTLLHACQAGSLAKESSSSANTDDASPWQPNEGTGSEWLACRGMPKDVCERTKMKKQELKKILAKNIGLGDIGDNATLSDSGVDQCIMFTEEQLDMMIAEAKKEDKAASTHRTKRTLTDLKKSPFSKWPMPIHYKFDGKHDEKQRATIRGAFQHWADNTCVRFRELATNKDFDGHHIIIKMENDGCWSRLGRMRYKRQHINLESNCVESFGVILHEIGHSLGLYHEQSRVDRDDYIKILSHNIKMDAWSQYMKQPTDAFGLPYNYGSIMHYSTSGFSVEGRDTMHALESLYRRNMGQRSDLSFNDRKIINLAYCKASCIALLRQPCQRGGYQDPNDCSTCICPDGFSGQYCNEVAQSKNANCGGVLNIASGTRQVIKSPGYDNRGYSNHQECTWWIKAPDDHMLDLSFSGDFSIPCRETTCFHWVEIKYKKDLGVEGPRFCCYRRPSDIVTSESNEMMIIFRSNYSLGSGWLNHQRGFQAIVKSTPKVNRKSLFRCSFEDKSSGSRSLCGMTQDKADNFDWTVFQNSTPSNKTGPDFPYDGDFYIYMDARLPRQSNDEARLFFPRLYIYGHVCVNFYYHMYGQYVNTLKLVRVNTFGNTPFSILWTKSGQSENSWLQASVEVYLQSCSQLHLVGIRGNGVTGDIGLDKIEVNSGPCPF